MTGETPYIDSPRRRIDDAGHQIERLYGGIGGPLYAVHLNGYAYAAFSGANDAMTYWRGLDTRGRGIFHIENAEGQTIRLEQGSPGHAYAIVEALSRAR